MKYTVSPIYRWATHLGENPRPDKQLFASEALVLAATSALLKMLKLLHSDLVSRIEHVGICWGQVHYSTESPHVVFVVKIDLPSGITEVAIDSSHCEGYPLGLVVNDEAKAGEFASIAAKKVQQVVRQKAATYTEKWSNITKLAT